jgi:hypothetical protein
MPSAPKRQPNLHLFADIRLATYYSARNDILRLWSGNMSDLAKLNATLGPPPVDFGKEPKHPLEDVMKAIGRQAAAARGGRESRGTG